MVLPIILKLRLAILAQRTPIGRGGISEIVQLFFHDRIDHADDSPGNATAGSLGNYAAQASRHPRQSPWRSRDPECTHLRLIVSICCGQSPQRPARDPRSPEVKQLLPTNLIWMPTQSGLDLSPCRHHSDGKPLGGCHIGRRLAGQCMRSIECP